MNKTEINTTYAKKAIQVALGMSKIVPDTLFYAWDESSQQYNNIARFFWAVKDFSDDESGNDMVQLDGVKYYFYSAKSGFGMMADLANDRLLEEDFEDANAMADAIFEAVTMMTDFLASQKKIV